MELPLKSPVDGVVAASPARSATWCSPASRWWSWHEPPARCQRRVTVVEVGPRDGLQNEAAQIPTATKIAFVDALAAAGLPVVEIAAFVNPARVPQMRDASEVARGIARRPGDALLRAGAQRSAASPRRTRRG